jgi:hypothetical protein
MQKEVLHGCHDIIMAGHLGQYKAIEKLKEAVIWHGMTQDCILYVKSCSTCNKNKKKTGKKAKAKLEQYHSEFPMERVHMDILKLLPIIKKGSK